MGNTNGTPGNSNIIATGHTMYINDKGETVTDTIHHYNGETVRSSETGILPTTGGGGGFITQQLYTPWVAIVVVATVFLLVSTLLAAIMKQRLSKKTRPIPTVDGKLHSIPLYSLNNPRSHLASGAKWNIDLLADV